MSYVGRKSGRAALISADIPSNLNLLGDYVKIPSATTTERDALTPAVGMMLYNTTLGIMQQYAASGWASINSPPTISSLNYPGDDTALDIVGEFNLTCTTQSSTTVLASSTTGIVVGQVVKGTGIPTSPVPTVESIITNTSFVLSGAATASASVTLTFNTQTLVITGTNFSVGATVTIDGTAPSTVTRDSSSQITVTGTPAKTAGTKVDGLVVSNTSGLSTAINVDYSPLPGWSSPASGNLATLFISGSAIPTIDLVGGSPATTSYALSSGSLPPGLAMSTSTGDITGTITGSTLTTYNITVDAIDAQAQSSPRLFNIITSALPTGGTITTYSGFRVHSYIIGMSEAFTFIPSSSMNVDWLVVAGGGGGGGNYGSFGDGGGGAGGFRTGASHAVTAQTYTITVGAAGAAGISGNVGTGTAGGDGGNSIFSTVTSTGGGGGGMQLNVTPMTAFANGHDGGSGGGGGGITYAIGTPGSGNTPSITPITGEVTTVQGYDGGSLADVGGPGGGGGGGASAVGANNTTNQAGNGGAGTANSYRTNSAVTYAGGGGGGIGSTGNRGVGGAGGGGSGGERDVYDGVNGSSDTGGGGGGGANGRTSGAGGSGIVIIRYAV
jgi:hypothetical protein